MKENTDHKTYIHVSFDEVDDFSPRIPDDTLQDEDKVTPRICVTYDMKDSLSAVPGILRTISGCQAIGYSPIIHVYKMLIPEEYVIHSDGLKDKVPDAYMTHECWLIKEPVKVTREDYRWHSPDARILKDRYGNVVPRIAGTFEPLPMVKDGGITDFIEFCHVDETVKQQFFDIVKRIGMSKMLHSLDRPLSVAIQQNRHEYELMIQEKDKEEAEEE